jgi:hypothetical protein
VVSASDRSSADLTEGENLASGRACEQLRPCVALKRPDRMGDMAARAKQQQGAPRAGTIKS